MDQTVLAQLTQLLGQDFVRDPRHQTPKFPEVFRFVLQPPEDDELPLTADGIQRRCQWAGALTSIHSVTRLPESAFYRARMSAP